MSRLSGGPIVAALAFVLTLVASPLRAADGQFIVVEKFGEGHSGLIVAHYTASNVERSKSKVGVITIASPGENAFAFNLAEWRQLIALCNKAIASESTGWALVGSMSETGTTDVSHLTLSSGPGLRFVIASPKDGEVSYVLQKNDLSRLKSGLRAVEVYLAAP